MKKFLEGSQAIAETIKLIKPEVIGAYPITPQTHIVEDLAKLKADGKADFEYVRAESEFAAASIVLGASAAGSRVYTATSSQGLLLMTEVVFNIAGMRLPVVMTCANRGVSAPITIWNDHQDAMTVRDAGWVMLFAENLQEAVDLHLVAYKVAEKRNVPVMVNVDGFVLTHTYEPVEIPTQGEVNKFLPKYKPAKGTYLDTKAPRSFGAFATPPDYLEIRQELHEAVKGSGKLIQKEIKAWNRIFKKDKVNGKARESGLGQKEKIKKGKKLIDNGLVEYYGSSNPETIFIAMGSMAGTVKHYLDNNKGRAGVLKIRSFRPLPQEEILAVLKKAKYVAVLDKSISLGEEGILAREIKAMGKDKIKGKVQSFVVGLGGRDITDKTFDSIITEIKGKDEGEKFIG
jgi:pyruvate ferredoxin oxidoreductase alpha subunit